MNKRLLTTTLGLVLLCALTFSENFAPSREKSEKQKKENLPLDGAVYAGYEYDGSSDYWSMAIKATANNKELFEVVWTKPLFIAAAPCDYNYRDAEKLVLSSNDGEKS